MAVLKSILELARVAASVLPFVLAKAFWLALRVLTNVTVTVGKEVRAVSLS